MRNHQPHSIVVKAIRKRDEAWRGLVEALPVMVGFVPFALVLGAQAAQKGFSHLGVSLMTGLNFGGGSEFAAIELWTSPPHIGLIVAMTFLVNCRHLLMGAALSPLIRHLPLRKALPALFFMCDESWAMGLADARKREADPARQALSLPFYFGVSIGLYLTWVVFTTLGAAAGPLLGDIRSYGFDMAFPAVFLVLLRGMWKSARGSLPWLISLVTAAGIHLLVPGAWFVAGGAVAGMLFAYAMARPS
ncbi:AzlC family ABC transporter permease [Dyella sp. LX-66]|uniref:AzlC family ABC transporter permease n=1 Tax=unclassified Dyella TaxID=2634549 RepID=UPI001BE023E7|nr:MULTISPECIES: AzlC family ABC transporter permease [unclassified Dyella]MBT2118922.1 AzlC family ABC transporter permease [Dyella sp. LX-1]MBT2140084.1 AzlC family ABC transporter permease [Dyella sp. LX-66]